MADINAIADQSFDNFTQTSTGYNLRRASEVATGIFTPTLTTILEDATIAPDGTVTADLIRSNAAGTRTRSIAASGFVSYSATSPMTYSVYLKPGNFGGMRIVIDVPGVVTLFDGQFNINDGGIALVQNNPSGVAPITVNAGNGWWRIIIYLRQMTQSGAIRETYRPLDGFGTNSVNNTANSGDPMFYIWGVQYESGHKAYAYNMTTADTAPNPATPGAYGRLGAVPFYASADQTIAPVNSSATARAIRSATAEQSLDPFVSNAAGRPLLDIVATGTTQVPPFVNTQTGSNYHAWSEVLRNYYSTTNVAFADDEIVDFKGDKVADALVATSTAAAPFATWTNGNGADSNVYTYSIFAKRGTKSRVRLQALINGGLRAEITVNLDTGTIVGTNGTVVSTMIQDHGNGWYRFGLAFTGPGNLQGRIQPLEDTGSSTVTGAIGDRYMYVSGCQFEYRTGFTAYNYTAGTVLNSNAPSARGVLGQRPAFAAGDQTIPPFVSNATAFMVRAASAAQQLDPIVSTGFGGVYATLFGSADQSLGEFRNFSPGYNLHNYSTQLSLSHQPMAATRTSIVEDVIMAPDGTMRGDAIVPTAGSSSASYGIQRRGSATSLPNTTNVFSFYAKAGTARYLYFYALNNFNEVEARIVIDLQLGSYMGQHVQNSLAINDAGDGWWRVELTGALYQQMSEDFYPSDSLNYAGVAAGQVGVPLTYLYGLQVESNRLYARPLDETGAQAPNPTRTGARGDLGIPPRVATSDTTMAPFVSNAVAFIVRNATADQTIDPVLSTGTARRLDVLQVIADQTVPAFRNTSRGYNELPYSSETSRRFSTVSAGRVTIVEDAVMAPDGTMRADTLRAGVSSTDGDYAIRTVTTNTNGGSGRYTYSFYAKPGTANFLRLRHYSVQFGHKSIDMTIDLVTGQYVYATDYVESPSTFRIDILDVGNGWRRIVLDHPGAGGSTETIWPASGLTLESATVTANAGDDLLHLFGWQDEANAPRVSDFQTTGAVAPDPNADGAFGRLGVRPLSLVVEQTVPPFTQTAFAAPIRFADAANSIEPFVSTGQMYIQHPAVGVQEVPPFTQVAFGGPPVDRAIADNTFGAFVQNVGGAPFYVGNSAIGIGFAATTTTIEHPALMRPGDLIVVAAGGHSDGDNDMDFMVAGFTLQALVRAPSNQPGFHEAMSVWTKIATAEDRYLTIAYNLPTDYTMPVVWAQSRIFRNALGIDRVTSTVIEPDVLYKNGLPIPVNQTDRVLASFWMFGAQGAFGGGVFQQGDYTSSDVGPDFTTGFYYRTVPNPTITSAEVGASDRYQRLLNISMTLLPSHTEGSVLTHASSENAIDPFVALQDIRVTAAQTIGPFLSDGKSFSPLTGDNLIAPFIGNAIGNLPVRGFSANTIEPFISYGFQSNHLFGGQTIAPFTIEGSGLIKLDSNTNGQVGPFQANAAAKVTVHAAADQIIIPFGSGRLTRTAYGGLEPIIVPGGIGAGSVIPPMEIAPASFNDYDSRARGNVTVHANTVTLVGAFTDEAMANVTTMALADQTFDDFIAGDIKAIAEGLMEIGPFAQIANAAAIPHATADQTIEPFLSNGDNAVHIQGDQSFGDFVQEAFGRAIAKLSTDAKVPLTVPEFTQSAEGDVIVTGTGAPTILAFTQNVILERHNRLIGVSALGEFASLGSLIVRSRPPDHGGVKFKGGFKEFRGFRFGARGEKPTD